MSFVEKFDILVFGGGKAGKTLAIDQAKAGKRVALVEAGMIGGSCINVACIPSKALIRSAQVTHSIKAIREFGLNAENVTSSFEAVRDRTARIVAEMVALNQANFDASGFELIIGHGKFVAPKTIEVQSASGARTVWGDKVFVNLGTTAAIPNYPGLSEAKPLTHVEALTLGELPTSLIVIGGGYIGMELGQAFSRLGSEVTILERSTRLASREDVDVSEGILKLLQAEGIEVAFSAGHLSVTGRSGQSVAVQTDDGRTFKGSHIVVAAGRRPPTGGIGLDIAGIEVDRQGFVVVDNRLRTTAKDVWAMGDVAGTPMFTHASLDDFRVVKSALTGGSRTTSERIIPYCVFIDPEFARVGLNEAEAIEQGISYRIAKLSMDVVPRARTLSERQGFMKALVANDDDRVLGFGMLGVNAGEVMSVVQMAMVGKLPYTALRDGIFAHPTITECLNMLFANVSASTVAR